MLDYWDRLETAQGRRAVVLETARQAVGRNVNAIAKSIAWQVYAALAATARGNSHDETRQQLNCTVQRTEVSLVDLMSAFYEAICDALGLRLRDCGLTYGHLAVAGASVVDGIALRMILTQANANNEHRDGLGHTLGGLLQKPLPGPAIDGGTADWTIAAWAYLGWLDAATEPIPDWTPTSERRAVVEGLRRQAREMIAAPRGG